MIYETMREDFPLRWNDIYLYYYFLKLTILYAYHYKITRTKDPGSRK